ncbi:aminotransferase class V-fold PLP-dependent enzyme [Leptospira sp. 96542]|nr:aminotransferase class V-fold PLP-dependent enzyme [Leptospira sp. 96542]
MTRSEFEMPNFPTFANWDGISRFFPVQNDSVWLNYCGTTPVSTYTIDVLKLYLDEYAKHGIFSPNFSEPVIKSEIRKYIAKILNVTPEEIGIVHNTSEGMNLYSHSIQIPGNKRILILENEYPSNVYPWEHWTKKNVTLDFVSIGKSPSDFLTNLETECKKGDVHLVSISPVHWCTGMVLDMEKVSGICQTYNVRLVVDGSQAVGHTKLDFQKTKVDFCAFAAWKWLLGPLGLGVIYIAKENSKNFQLVFKGQASVVNDSSYFPYRDEWKSPADQFEQSTSNFNDWIYFYASLRMLDSLGFDRVRERIYEIAELMRNMLHSLGFTLENDGYANIKTGILAITGHKDPTQFRPEEIQSFLKKKKIITAVRLGRLRMAPHIAIEPVHVEKIKLALEEFLNQ